MYLSEITIENFRCFGEGKERFVLSLKPGLTALVGENDSGKSAVIDALRFALGTADREWLRLEDTDFHIKEAEANGEKKSSETIRIVCKFEFPSEEENTEAKTGREERAFPEYLTYEGDKAVLYVHWTAQKSKRSGRSFHKIEVHSGKDGKGPIIVQEVRDLLRATYLRPLRDAEHALSAGQGSRLSQILRQVFPEEEGKQIVDQIDQTIEDWQEIKKNTQSINKSLEKMDLANGPSSAQIRIGGAATDALRVRRLLERLELRREDLGKVGLGSDNLLFMAAELLLLAQQGEVQLGEAQQGGARQGEARRGEVGNKLLLIEEPEAHLHPQRQLRLMKFLQEQAEKKGVQIIVTTHSPNLTSVIDLNNMVILHGGRAFPLREGKTKLDKSDYRFLQRFLDVTKANLFFARGVMIVEGDAENILLPTLASLLGCDFTEHGVSIVNVGGVGLRRYARIFQRDDPNERLEIPVACVTDMDVMPDCAPYIIGKVGEGRIPDVNKRRWHIESDFGDSSELGTLDAWRQKIEDKASGQCVRTFVADKWTLEYDLAYAGLAREVYIAAWLAKKDKGIDEGKIGEAIEAFSREKLNEKDGEVLASHVYAMFAKDGVSKAIAAQYLAEILEDEIKEQKMTKQIAEERKKENKPLTCETLQDNLPSYLVEAIKYVTRSQSCSPCSPSEEEGRDDA